MPSVQARLLSICSSLLTTVAGFIVPGELGALNMVKKNLAKNIQPVVVPQWLISEQGIEVKCETMVLTGGQTWQVFRFAPKNQQSSKVVLFMHGGGFVGNVDSLHFSSIKSLVISCGTTVILPVYAVAPVGTATLCIAASLDLLLRMSEQYHDQKLALVGDSAGGWIAMRMLLALNELITDRQVPLCEGLKGHPQSLLDTRRRLTSIILFSPMLDLAMENADDSNLGRGELFFRTTLRVSAHIWAYGPHQAFPHFDFGLDRLQETSPKQTNDPISVSTPLSDPMFTLVGGIEVLRACQALDLMLPPVQVTQFIGTHDILYGENVQLHHALCELGADIVGSEMQTYVGLVHIFHAITMLPESRKVWNTVAEILSRR